DSGAFTLHMRAPTGTRIEETAALCDQVESEIRKQIPPQEFSGVIDNIGLPYSGINLSYSNSAPVGTQDADIIVTLAAKHRPTADYVHSLRLNLPREFPGVTFYFLPSDLVTLSGSSQTAPTFWLNPKNGVSYSIATQTPQYRVQTLQDLDNIPVTGTGNAPPSILASLASLSRGSELSVVSHYNVAPVIDIFGSVQGRDLGSVSKDIFSMINASQK